MQLGIEGRKALLCASNAGLGLACAKAVAAEGVDVVINGRNPEKVAAAKAEVRSVSTGSVQSVLADVCTDEGREALLSVCPDPDILLNNNAGPKPKRFMETARHDWEETYQANYLAPILLVHAVLPGMIERRFGRIINITSAMVTTPRPHHTMSAGARADLTASLKALSCGSIKKPDGLRPLIGKTDCCASCMSRIVGNRVPLPSLPVKSVGFAVSWG